MTIFGLDLFVYWFRCYCRWVVVLGVAVGLLRAELSDRLRYWTHRGLGYARRVSAKALDCANADSQRK